MSLHAHLAELLIWDTNHTGVGAIFGFVKISHFCPMDVYNGCTSWIEDDCPDTFSEFIFQFPSCSCSVSWISYWLTVLKHKKMQCHALVHT